MLQNGTAHRLAKHYAGHVDDGSPLFAFAHYGRIRDIDQLIGDLAKRAESSKGISSVKTTKAYRDLSALLLYVKDALSSRVRTGDKDRHRFIQRGRRAFVTMWEVRDDMHVVTQGAQ
jgi:hypothetical protein